MKKAQPTILDLQSAGSCQTNFPLQGGREGRMCMSMADFDQAMKMIKKVDVIALDTETSGLHPWQGSRVAGVSIYDGGGVSWYLPFFHKSPGLPPAPQPELKRNGQETGLSQARMNRWNMAWSDAHHMPKKAGELWPCQLPPKCLQRLVESLVGKTLIGHNIKFDVEILLMTWRWCDRGFKDPSSPREHANERTLIRNWLRSVDLHDTKVMARVGHTTARVLGLKHLAESYWPGSTAAQSRLLALLDRRGHGGKNPRYDFTAPWEMAKYACLDPVLTYDLWSGPLAEILTAQTNWPLYDQERMALKVTAEMEINGICVNTDVAARLAGECDMIRGFFKTEFERLCGSDCEVNLNSQPQLAAAFKAAGVDLVGATAQCMAVQKDNNRKRRDGEAIQVVSTRKEVLDIIQHPAAFALRNFRMFESIGSDFLAKIPDLAAFDGRVHGNFDSAGAVTGRFTSSQPNLQNLRRDVPDLFGGLDMWLHSMCDRAHRNVDKALLKRLLSDMPRYHVRDVYLPSAGRSLFLLDYSQIEYRGMAEYSRDAAMLAAFNAGKDLHQETADKINEVFGNDTINRKQAKNVNFAMLYGIGNVGLAALIHKSEEMVAKIKRAHAAQFPGVGEFMKEAAGLILRKGQVRNLYGRIYRMHPSQDYVAVNYECQGTAAEQMKEKMVKVHQYLVRTLSDIDIVLQVHDELVFDVPLSEEHRIPDIKAIMEDFSTEIPGLRPAFTVPVVVDVERAPDKMGTKFDWPADEAVVTVPTVKRGRRAK